LCPLSCSNIGTSALIISGIGPAVLTTVISAAIAALPVISVLKQLAAAQTVIFDHVLMIFSKDLSEFVLRDRYFCVCLKYLKSGGAWFFLAGIKSPSPLRK
jgi:hypothetical protein